MSADGKLVYGKLTHFADPTDVFSQQTISTFVWSKEKGLRNLQELATSAGITVPTNHMLINVQAVSGEGRVVLGTALEPPADPSGFGTEKLFVLVLPDGAL